MSSSSGLSSLSTAPSISDDEVTNDAAHAGKLDHYFKKASSATSPPQPKRKRPASPPHEYVLADNEDIAVSFSCSIAQSVRHKVLCVR